MRRLGGEGRKAVQRRTEQGGASDSPSLPPLPSTPPLQPNRPTAHPSSRQTFPHHSLHHQLLCTVSRSPAVSCPDSVQTNIRIGMVSGGCIAGQQKSDDEAGKGPTEGEPGQERATLTGSPRPSVRTNVLPPDRGDLRRGRCEWLKHGAVSGHGSSGRLSARLSPATQLFPSGPLCFPASLLCLASSSHTFALY